MATQLAPAARSWWAMALRGLAALVFGIVALIWPAITLLVLVTLFGVYALWDGIFAIVGAIRAAEHHRQWWLLLVEGIVGIIAGLIALFLPGVTALSLVYIIAA